MHGPVLEATRLASGYRKRRQSRVVVPPVDLRVDPGELVCLLGPNGAGKSTLLRTVSGVQQPLGGSVALVGDPLDRIGRIERARRLATVLTERVTVGQLAGYDLVALGRHPHTGWGGALSADDHRVVSEAIMAVGAAHLAERDVDELSDGERQRLMIARGLAQEPALLVLDEPTAFLDVTSRIELGAMLQRLAHERGLGVVCSTHDLDLALATADTVWLLSGEGEIRVGAPEDLALSGAIGEVFGSQDLDFDAERGTFSRRSALTGVATVEGEGVAAVLCARALRRVGFAVNDAPSGTDADVDVRVVVGPVGTHYELAIVGADPVRFGSIQDVCRHVTKRLVEESS
ncbi:MAG: ABC transporter ATP-binding protein [Actinomycetota bacterium]